MGSYFSETKNLFKETLEVLAKHRKTPRSVVWCGSKTFGRFTFEQFRKIADVWYEPDQLTMGHTVCEDLIVCGTTYWLERHCGYARGEEWAFREMPSVPERSRVPETLFVFSHADFRPASPSLKDSNDTLEKWYRSRVSGKAPRKKEAAR